MSRARWWLLRWSVLLAALSALPVPALGYVRTTTESGKPFVWPSPNITVLVYTGDPPVNVTREKLLHAANAAAATWSYPQVSCTSMMLSTAEFDGTEADVAFDKFNRVTFRRSEWRKVPCDASKELCAPYDGQAMAITSVFALKSDGTILDSDMELNAVGFRWADVVADGPGVSGAHDLQNTLTHEFGHLIGFDHNCYDPRAGRPQAKDHTGQLVPYCRDATAATRAATMFNSADPMTIDKRDLTEDDVQAVCDVYPHGQPPVGVTPEEPGGCALAGHEIARSPRDRDRPGALPVIILLAALGAAISARRRAPGPARRPPPPRG